MSTAPRLDLATWQRHRQRNRLQSVALLAFMGGFLALLGWLWWGPAGILSLLIAGLAAVLMNPATSPRWVMRLYGAQPLHPDAAPGLWQVLRTLAGRAGLSEVPVPHYVPSRLLNAFAVGSPTGSAIAVTDGLLHRLDDRELVGVLAHEVGHIALNDLWVMGLADLISRFTGALALLGFLLLAVNLPLVLAGHATVDWAAVLLLVIAPQISAIAQLALSRTREYDADLYAARLTGDPAGLAAALRRIDQVQGRWLERLLLPGRGLPEPSLLRTHPSTDERVARLASLRESGRVPLQNHLSSSRRARPDGLSPVHHPPRWHLTGLWH